MKVFIFLKKKGLKKSDIPFRVCIQIFNCDDQFSVNLYDTSVLTVPAC